jgi:membrane protein
MDISAKVSQFRDFVEVGVWKQKTSLMPRYKRFFYQTFRVIIISIAEFQKDKITEKASAMTYFSLLSIVPTVAMAFGIAKGFGLEKYLKLEMEKYFTQEEVLNQVIAWSEKMLNTADGGIISGISFVFLMYAVLRLMYNIELSFNEIWSTKSRSWQRKISDYLAIILLAPIFIILSSSATVFVTTQIENLTARIELLGYFKPAILFGLKFIPYTLIWLLLTLLYIIFPNTGVKILPAVIAGILAGTVFQLTQWGWINGQVYLSKYSVVYGTFAALPLFMIYLQLSWLIVLFGAEFAYAIQYANTWDYSNTGLKLSLAHKRKLTVLVAYHIIKNFESGNPPMSASELSTKIHVPLRFVRDICKDLVEARIFSRMTEEGKNYYQPALDINRIDLYLLFERLDELGYNELKSNVDAKYLEIEGLYLELNRTIKNASGNKLIKDL